MPTNVRDPRSIITPDAFELSKDLLGTPLASPWRRLGALLVDLAVIGVLTAVTASFSLILWGAVAVFLVTMAFRSPSEGRSQVTSILFRGATGCLGVVILLGVLIAYIAIRSDSLSEVAESALRGAAPPPVPVPDAPTGLGGLLEGLSGVAAFREADDADAAVEGAVVILRTAGVADLTEAEARSLLEELTPDDAPWASVRDSVWARALREAGLSDTAPQPQVTALSDAEALALLAELHASAPDDPRYDVLRRRLVPLLASDTLAVLSEAMEDVRDDLARSERRLAEAQEALDAEGEGFVDLIRDLWDQAGSAVGLWSLYFTVALTLTRGQTVGKKLFGLRVLRLDGLPLNWWASFERAGGYVAGIATGTLGFVQVFWDPNRQCVHDKIVGTVVVIDGARIEPGAWQEAWAAARKESQ